MKQCAHRTGIPIPHNVIGPPCRQRSRQGRRHGQRPACFVSPSLPFPTTEAKHAGTRSRPRCPPLRLNVGAANSARPGQGATGVAPYKRSRGGEGRPPNDGAFSFSPAAPPLPQADYCRHTARTPAAVPALPLVGSWRTRDKTGSGRAGRASETSIDPARRIRSLPSYTQLQGFFAVDVERRAEGGGAKEGVKFSAATREAGNESVVETVSYSTWRKWRCNDNTGLLLDVPPHPARPELSPANNTSV
jgi:hypothetical protein